MANLFGTSTMTGADMVALRQSLGMTQSDFSQIIGRTKRTIISYEADEQPIPLVVALACRAIAEGWRDYGRQADGPKVR